MCIMMLLPQERARDSISPLREGGAAAEGGSQRPELGILHPGPMKRAEAAEQELRGAHLGLNSQARLDFILGSVADAVTVDTLFGDFRIDTIYHAAAYKHVPIVEQNPLEGLRNNVLGTWYLARAAAQMRLRREERP